MKTQKSPRASVGGANVQRLTRLCPQGRVSGIDYSEISVEKSRRVNKRAIDAGRCEIRQASVTDLPFPDAQFDAVTAFETVYFWPELPRSFKEVRRVLKGGGTFLLCNECGGDRAGDEKWTEQISGMTIYRDAELQALPEQTGFRNIEIRKNRRGWLCMTAKK